MTEDQLRDELDQWKMVRYRMEDEGIEYCFKYYSDFKEIKDEKFHVIKKELLDKTAEMWNYVQQKITEVENKLEE